MQCKVLASSYQHLIAEAHGEGVGDIAQECCASDGFRGVAQNELGPSIRDSSRDATDILNQNVPPEDVAVPGRTLRPQRTTQMLSTGVDGYVTRKHRGACLDMKEGPGKRDILSRPASKKAASRPRSAPLNEPKLVPVPLPEGVRHQRVPVKRRNVPRPRISRNLSNSSRRPRSAATWA